MESELMQQSQAHVEANEAAAQLPVQLIHGRWSRLYTALAIVAVVIALALTLLPRLEKPVSAAPQQQIEQRARLIGARTLERLVAADNLVRLISADIELHGITSETPTAVSLETFSSIALLRSGQAPVIIKGRQQAPVRPDPLTLNHIANGRTALVSGDDGTDRGPTLLRVVNLLGNAQPGLLSAELSPEYLWHGSAGKNNETDRLCVRDSAGNPVFCNASESASATVATTSGFASPQPQGLWHWFVPQEQLTGKSQLAIAQAFGGRDWVVSVEQAGPAISASPRQLAMFYIAAGMVSAFIALVLAWFGSRRTGDAGSLQTALGRVSSGTASRLPALTRVMAAKTDRTQEPGKTPDQLLGVLSLFSEIDRAILSGATFDRITQTVFPRIRAVLPGDASALALLDYDNPANSKMTICGPGDHREDCDIKGALDARSTGRLASMPDGDWLDSAPEDALLAPLHKLGMSRCLVLPVYKDGIAAGALILANRDARSVDKHGHALARDIAHRLGVAYTSATRGQQLLFHSLYDSTTELPNRKYFESRLGEEISRARRESRLLALLLVDLDDFKKVNDSFGHEGGDILLEQASLRLKTCLRAEDLVARVGSDEFGVLVPTISQTSDAATIAQKLIETLSEPYTLAGREHHLSATIGVAVFPEDGKSSHSLLRSADFAMHAAKRDGGATYSTYEAQSSEHAQDQAALAIDLRHAIAKSELTLYFQPQIDLRHGEIVGAEALVRWQHRTRGMVMPGAFISIAEQSDLIEQVGEFVRREASAQFRAWEQEGTAPMRISVNVSSREFKRKDFVDRIEDTLVTSGMRPFSLELEITESLLVDNSEHVVASLKALSDRGVRIAIDDFGTGYSSMAYLKNLPFHVLKIDRSFVKDIGAADGSDSIVNAIIGVAQGLGKEIVAEGIEIEAQRAFLAEAGCEMGQGYLWSRPVPADEFAAFVRNWNATARRVAAIE